MMEIKKQVGKSKPIHIGIEEQVIISEFKAKLRYILDSEYATQEEKGAVSRLFALEPYDLNLILGYYSIGGGSSIRLAKKFGVQSRIVKKHIEDILDKLR